MATAQTSPSAPLRSPPPAADGARNRPPAHSLPSEELTSAPALAPVLPAAPAIDEEEKQLLEAPVARLPVELDVVVPVRAFRVRHLLALEAGKLIESQAGYGEDVPLAAGDVQLAWSEFEVIDNRIAVRITRLP